LFTEYKNFLFLIIFNSSVAKITRFTSAAATCKSDKQQQEKAYQIYFGQSAASDT